MNCSAHCAPATFLSSLNTRIHSIDFNIFAIYSSLLLVSLLFSLEIFSHWSINSNESSIFSFLQFEKNPIFPKLICEQSVDLKKKKGKKERKKHKEQINTLDRNAWSAVQSHSWGTSPPSICPRYCPRLLERHLRSFPGRARLSRCTMEERCLSGAETTAISALIKRHSRGFGGWMGRGMEDVCVCLSLSVSWRHVSKRDAWWATSGNGVIN